MRKGNLAKWSGTAAVIGVDFGDSGKGRLIDDMASRAHIVARFSGGSNTGHTVVNQFGKFALHIIPSGIFNPKATCIIGRGVACDLESLIDDEFVQLTKAGVSWRNLRVDPQVSLTMPWHKLRDSLREKWRHLAIGTTKRGVGPTYADRVARSALRLSDLFDKNFKDKLKNELNFQNKNFELNLSFIKIYEQFARYRKIIKPLALATNSFVKEAIKNGKNVLFEGTQGWLLDVDSGTYPYVTSTNTGMIGIWRSFDLHPSQFDEVIGITKAYTTRVGGGPLPTKLVGKEKEIIVNKGQEIGTTSGRIRDPGWLDLVLARAAVEANRVTTLAVTKLDVLTGFEKIKICTAYKINGQKKEYRSGDAQYLFDCQPFYESVSGWQEDISNIRNYQNLPTNAQKFIRKIEDHLKIPVQFISVGPKRGQVIYK